MGEGRKASSLSSTSGWSISQNKLESESYGPYEAKRSQYIRKAHDCKPRWTGCKFNNVIIAQWGGLLRVKKAISTEISLGKCKSLVWPEQTQFYCEPCSQGAEPISLVIVTKKQFMQNGGNLHLIVSREYAVL